MSCESSTTQTMRVSRRGSRQMAHSSPPSLKLKQREQNDTRSLASTMARLRRSASSLGAFKRWNATRWADFGPIPGSRPSWSMSSWTVEE